jgi:hypothetical protein
MPNLYAPYELGYLPVLQWVPQFVYKLARVRTLKQQKHP